MNKAKLYFVFNIVMAIVFVLTVFTGYAMPERGDGIRGAGDNIYSEMHSFLGGLLIVLVVIHGLLHWRWFISIAKSFFTKKTAPAANLPENK
jgi:hypothetical protein